MYGSFVLLRIWRCRPQLTTPKPQKAQKAQNKGSAPVLCLLPLLLLWLGSVLHSWFRVFLKEIADINGQTL